MHARALILIANILLILGGCATAGAQHHEDVNPAPLAAREQAAAVQFAPRTVGAYLTPAALNLYRLLPPPPEAGSAQERAELDELLRIQATRTPADVLRAQEDANVTVFRFADALGSPAHFTPAELPLTVALFRSIGSDESLFMNDAKDRFARPRPFVTESRLSPVVPRPPSASYPSGHTTWAVACAIVLADMVPERRAQIFARADEYSRNREVGGVHYPSDVAGGHLAGTALAAALFISPAFQNDEAAAAAELRRALGLPAPVKHPIYRH